jgi:L,D-transpeptidase ErfK/SrfK
VRIINQPVMVGDRDNRIYLSVYEPLGEYPGDQDKLLEQAMYALTLYAAPIDWNRVEQVVNARQLVPTPVSVGAPSLDDIIASIKPEKYAFEPYGIEANDAMPPDVPR